MSSVKPNRLIIDAVADGTLPVRPGDIIILMMLNEMVTIVHAQEQSPAKTPNSPLSPGQWVTYVFGDVSGSPHVETGYLEWSTFDAYWTVMQR